MFLSEISLQTYDILLESFGCTISYVAECLLE